MPENPPDDPEAQKTRRELYNLMQTSAASPEFIYNLLKNSNYTIEQYGDAVQLSINNVLTDFGPVLQQVAAAKYPTNRSLLSDKRIENIYKKMSAMTTPLAHREVDPAKVMKGQDYLIRYEYDTYVDPADKKKKPLYLFEVQTQKVVDDINTLVGLKSAFPEATAELDEMITLLVRLIRSDKRSLAEHNFKSEKANRPASKAIGEMGRMTGFIMAGAGAILTGIPSIIQFIKTGKMSAAPFIFGGLALYFAKPDLLKPQDKIIVTEIKAVLDDPKMIALMKEYEVKGTKWASMIEDMMKKPEKIKEIVALQENGDIETKNEKEGAIDTAYKFFGLTDPNANQNIRGKLGDMIKKRDFSAFAAFVAIPQSKDAKKILLDYVQQKAIEYAK